MLPVCCDVLMELMFSSVLATHSNLVRHLREAGDKLSVGVQDKAAHTARTVARCLALATTAVHCVEVSCARVWPAQLQPEAGGHCSVCQSSAAMQHVLVESVCVLSIPSWVAVLMFATLCCRRSAAGHHAASSCSQPCLAWQPGDAGGSAGGHQQAAGALTRQ
jgi:hypothetical protein